MSTMKFVKTLTIILLILSNSALAQNCPKNSTDGNFINIKQKNAKLKIYKDLNVNVFNDTSNLHNTKIVMGLTIGHISLSSDFKFKYTKIKNQYCANIEKININYALDSLYVYLPNDFKPGTCEYEEVKKHEYEHVKIYRNTYKEYFYKLKQMLYGKNSIVKPQDSILVTNIKEAEEIFKEDLNKVLEEFNSKLTKDLNERQKSIDTEDNYQLIQSRCKNWSKIALTN